MRRCEAQDSSVCGYTISMLYTAFVNNNAADVNYNRIVIEDKDVQHTIKKQLLRIVLLYSFILRLSDDDSKF